MKFLHIAALILLTSTFPLTAARAQSEVDAGPFGAPEPNPSPTAEAPPPVFYSTPAESVTGAPAPNPSPAGEAHRPPVVYSTPNEGALTTPAAPGDMSGEDFENLHYQREMWREYQRDYNQHSPRPRNGPERE